MIDTDTELSAARATIADITQAKDGDILRACTTLAQHGDPDEREQAHGIRALMMTPKKPGVCRKCAISANPIGNEPAAGEA